MKIYGAEASPYSRKVRVVVMELGVEAEFIKINTLDQDSDFGSVNPLHRIPVLIAADGRILFDSPVIAEYLDVTYGPSLLLPPEGEERWDTLTLQALGDGLMDAAVPRRHEKARPDPQQSPERLALYERSMNETLDYLNRRVDWLSGVNVGNVSVSCALEYISFRHPEDAWEKRFPHLSAWNAAFRDRPSMKATRFPS